MSKQKPPAKRSFLPEVEEQMLALWQEKHIFDRSVSERPANKSYVFYDGPPYATGLPHIGHLLASTVKDVMPRYKTMRGHKVERRFGWDCHGLPIEVLVEKKLGLNSKKDIETYGVGKFNEQCRSIVLTYVDEWKKTITRLGRWVDFDNDYKTMDLEYMESALWVFKTLHDKGLVYEDYRSSQYCTRCETPLSKMETAMDDNYHDTADPSVYVAFPLRDHEDAALLAWTTTPWSISANTAIAVHPELRYVEAEIIKAEDKAWVGRHVIVAEARANEVLGAGNYTVHENFLGKEIVGWQYEPVQPFMQPDSDNGHRVVLSENVSADDGTGVLHVAPAFGEEDFELGRKEQLPTLLTIDEAGRYVSEITPYAGMHIKEADDKIIEDLQAAGHLFKAETITHSFPYCWRCQSPLIYKIQKSFFVKVADVKTGMQKTNQAIRWVPKHLQDGRFGQGMETAPDWGVSRSRYWGIPLPIWRCDKCDKQDVVGSLDDLEQLAGKRPSDLHRPMIDEVTWACNCGGTKKRVPEVFDVWFDSGTMPYGQLHYPFKNKAQFDTTFPADFITEYIPQTRGWFYYLHVLSNALFGKSAFKNCVATGTILAEDGTKMSKSKGNMPDSNALLDTYGADALRLWLLQGATIRGEEVNYSEEQIAEALKKVLLPFWNVYTFFALYAPKEGTVPVMEKPSHALDRWILARLEETRGEIEQGLEDYELWKAVRPLAPFINDLSAWYVRRSRDRFKGDDEADKTAALSTLFTVLVETTKLLAPFTPFIAEAVYQRLQPLNNEAIDSVHLEAWPAAKPDREDTALLRDTEVARAIIEIGHALRAQEKLKVRQPLARVWVSGVEVPKYLAQVILEELNVKVLATDAVPDSAAVIEAERGMTVAFDTMLTPELKQEGLLRDFVRQVNALRKKQGLSIEDSVTLIYQTDSATLAEMIAAETEAIKKDVVASDVVSGQGEQQLKINGEIISVTLDR